MKFRDIFALVALAYVIAILAFVHIGRVNQPVEHWNSSVHERRSIEVLKAAE